MLYTTILVTEDTITKEELMFFLSGGVALASTPNNPMSSWLPDKSWAEISRVHVLASFANFQRSFVQKGTEWKRYYDSLNPEDLPLPDPWETLTPFQKLIVVRMIRTDKVTIMVRKITVFDSAVVL